MARRISKKIARESISTYLKMREMWIGFFLVALILGVGAKTIYDFISKQSLERILFISRESNVSKNFITMNESKLTPELIPAVSTVSGELETTVSPTTSITPTPKKEAPKVTVLANTSGNVIVIAQKNDNFWKIAKRVCGNGRYNLSIQRYNRYGKKRALQPGDTIEVICSF